MTYHPPKRVFFFRSPLVASWRCTTFIRSARASAGGAVRDGVHAHASDRCRLGQKRKHCSHKICSCEFLAVLRVGTTTPSSGTSAWGRGAAGRQAGERGGGRGWGSGGGGGDGAVRGAEDAGPRHLRRRHPGPPPHRRQIAGGACTGPLTLHSFHPSTLRSSVTVPLD
jgi:hypothetical protein